MVEETVGTPLAKLFYFSPNNFGIEPSCCGLWREPKWEQVDATLRRGCLPDCVQLRVSFRLNATKVHERLISKEV